MRNDPIEEALGRPAQHASVDGLADLAAGVLVLLLGTAVVAEQLWPSLRGVSAWAGVIGAAVLLVLTKPLTSGLARLRARWVYPRVGYVKLRGPSSLRTAAVLAVSVVVAGAMAFLVARSAGWQALKPLLMGVTYAAGAALLWARLGLRRLAVYALLTLLAGGLAQWWLPGDLGAGLVMVVAGLSWIVGGSLLLWALLRKPVAMEDQA